jgi:hypothetical protein
VVGHAGAFLPLAAGAVALVLTRHGDTSPHTAPAWAEAQYVRLTQSIEAGCPVDRPSVVASRYGIS